jgi:two-component system, OmpR family, sensor kinase
MTGTGETGCVGAGVRIPLRVLLPCLAVSLTAIGAVVIGLAAMSGATCYLARQADRDLLTCAGSLLRRGVLAPPGASPVSGPAPSGTCGMELLSASGQVLTSAAPSAGLPVPAGGRWLAAHLARPVTVPGTGASGGWRIVIEDVRYQPQRIPYVYGPDNVRYVISGRPGPGPSGLLVVTAGLAAASRVTGRLTATYAAAAAAVLVLLAGAAFAVTRAILRPLRRAAGGAGATRDGWPFGPALTRLSERLCASRTAEAAARRAADEMSGQLGETARQLRRSVSIVRGSAQYYRQQPGPPAAGLDRMLRRAADEAARMQALIEGLDARSAAADDGVSRDGRPGSGCG